MKYLLFYRDKWSELTVGMYDTYGEALIAMVRARKWYNQRPLCDPVRFCILEVSYD